MDRLTVFHPDLTFNALCCPSRVRNATAYVGEELGLVAVEGPEHDPHLGDVSSLKSAR
jgi:hypothetical protein